MRNFLHPPIFSLLLFALMAEVASADGTAWLARMVPFRKRVEAEIGQDYRLTEEQGPWLIHTASFKGETAVDSANELVFELRKRFKLAAYYHEHVFALDTDDVALTGGYGASRRVRYRGGDEVREIGVLVGNFDAVDDPDVQKTLRKIKYDVYPQCLGDGGEDAGLTFGPLRKMQRALTNRGNANQTRGPLGRAFVTTNPLIPPEYFSPKGVNKFVEEMNADFEYSLLESAGEYTVKVATFRGFASIGDGNSSGRKKKSSVSRLEAAGHKAHVLTLALRQKGHEAWEFHDEASSIVTVGSFPAPTWGARRAGSLDAEERKQRDIALLMRDPQVQRYIKTFQAERANAGIAQQRMAHQFAAQKGLGGFAAMGLQPKTLRADGSVLPSTARSSFAVRGQQWKGELEGVDTIPFDMTPEIIEVPRRAISKDYHRTARR